MSAAVEWWMVTQSRCDRCHRVLRWLEGPLCDGCVDDNELVGPGEDKYRGIRERDRREAAMAPDPEIEPSSRPSTGSDLFAVDLETGAVTRFRRSA